MKGEAATREEAMDFIVKPFDEGKMVNALEKAWQTA